LTRPHELRELVRRQQRDRYDILRRAADPQDVGGLIGGLGVLPRWRRTLPDHPHVHGLVPAGGVAADRPAWRPARPSDLVPVQALATRFRGLVLALLRQERPDRRLPEAAWTNGGVVSCTPTGQGPEQGLNDLGREVHRRALPHRRRLAIAAGHVGCRSQEAQDQRWQTMTLPARECIRRVLPHVWPQGFHNVRDEGRWRPVHRPLRHQLQRWLAGQVPDRPPTSPPPASPAAASWAPPLRAGHPCPSCAQGLRVVIRSLPRPPRGPP
jgi:Putative transposase